LLQTPAEAAPGSPEGLFPVPDEGPAAGPYPAVDTVRLNPWELQGSESKASPAAETFQGDTTGGVASGFPAGFLASGSSVDLDVAPPQLVPIIRVSETGSVVVSQAEATAPPPEAHVEIPPEPPAVSVGVDAAAHGAAGDQPAPAVMAVETPAAVAATDVPPEANEPPVLAGVFVPDAVDAVNEMPTAGERAAPAAGNISTVVVAAGVPTVLFLLVFMYASAITLLCMYLIWTRPGTADLPDLSPKISPKGKKNAGVTLLQYVPPLIAIPAANVLRLGETQRFGSLRVTPLAVTRGSVEFCFYKPDVNETRAPEGPVLKLHLRFENISTDQDFVPLDPQLVFTKEPVKKRYGAFTANNFVCNVAERSQLEKHVYIFDMPDHSNWLMKGQNLDRAIAPGESFECFIPTTTEQIETLSGDLVWRVHFRKGYNPNSFRGVTTLIEVLFRSADIIDEAPMKAEPAAKAAQL
jgi:hypothetical protein